jgi:hypothetical protein
MSLDEQQDLLARLRAQRRRPAAGVSDSGSDTESSVTTASDSAAFHRHAPAGATLSGHGTFTIRLDLSQAVLARLSTGSSHPGASAPATPVNSRPSSTARNPARSTPATPTPATPAHATPSPARASARSTPATPAQNSAAQLSHSSHRSRERVHTPPVLSESDTPSRHNVHGAGNRNHGTASRTSRLSSQTLRSRLTSEQGSRRHAANSVRQGEYFQLTNFLLLTLCNPF